PRRRRSPRNCVRRAPPGTSRARERSRRSRTGSRRPYGTCRPSPTACRRSRGSALRCGGAPPRRRRSRASARRQRDLESRRAATTARLPRRRTDRAPRGEPPTIRRARPESGPQGLPQARWRQDPGRFRRRTRRALPAARKAAARTRRRPTATALTDPRRPRRPRPRRYSRPKWSDSPSVRVPRPLPPGPQTGVYVSRLPVTRPLVAPMIATMINDGSPGSDPSFERVDGRAQRAATIASLAHPATALSIRSEPAMPPSRPSRSRPLSLNVHLPWCVRKCPYCDFNSYRAAGSVPEAEYVDALLRDLGAELDITANRPVHTVFIGGGTPSLFSPD